MINVSFLHKYNHTGEILLNTLRQNFDNAVYNRVIKIEDTPFLLIKIIDQQTVINSVINSTQSIINSFHPDSVAGILSLNNIVFESKSIEMINKSYDILIFNMSTISIRQTIFSSSKNPGKYISESECSRAADLGKRAIYLLGLDYGMVTVAMTGKRKLKVLNIDPSPVIREKDLNSLVAKLESIFFSSPFKEKPIKLGADPEFMLFNSKSGKLIAASEFFPRDGLVGCDNIRIPNRQQRPVAEIRPNPEISPHDLVDNIKNALNTASKLAPYRNVKWVAGSQPAGGYSIGGHIHFSNVNLNYSLLRALDNYVGIPAFLIENPVSAVKRRKRYGLLADFRIKDYGGFEYRTPGSWLVSPQIALAILCLAKIVATHHMELNINYLNNYEAQQAFYSGNQDYFRSMFKHIWSAISSTETYSQYSSELKVLYDMITNSITWDEKSDLRTVWKISGISKRHYNTRQKSIIRVQETSHRPTSNTHRGINTESSTGRNNGSQRNTRSTGSSTGHVNRISRLSSSHRNVTLNSTQGSEIRL